MSSVMSREAAAGYARWEPPTVGEGGPAVRPPPAETSHPTVSDLEALERQAREEGFAAGRAEGLAGAQKDIAAKLARLEALCLSAARPLQELDAQTERELAQLAMVIARRVVAHELATTPERIADAVREAAAALPSATRELKVRLHPDDLALLRELDAAEPHWQLLADPALARGDCVLESERSRLDARLQTRLAALVDAALGDDALPADTLP